MSHDCARSLLSCIPYFYLFLSRQAYRNHLVNMISQRKHIISLPFHSIPLTYVIRYLAVVCKHENKSLVNVWQTRLSNERIMKSSLKSSKNLRIQSR